mgnify:CR=1 FL=1
MLQYEIKLSDNDTLKTKQRIPVNEHEERFQEFHFKHPEVYKLFNMFTKELISRGYKNGSAHMVIHRIRWETSTRFMDKNPATGEPLKISNGHFPYYARLWMNLNPNHVGFFRTKKLKGQ